MRHAAPPGADLRLVFRLGWLLAALGCAGETSFAEGGGAYAVVGGTPDPEDAAVVAITLRRQRCEDVPQVALCSGTLIAERVVVTAAHCLDVVTAPGLEVFFGPRLGAADGVYRGVVEASVFQADADSPSLDLALLRLDAPAPVAPLPLSPRPLAQFLVGTPVRVAGFGEARDLASPRGERRSGTAVLTAIDETSFTYRPGPAMTCQGDSGGPAFAVVEGVETLVGVTSRGDPRCVEYGRNVRIDVALPTFIRPFLDAEPAATERPQALALCAVSCARDADCPMGLVCGTELAPPRCHLPGAAPGELREPCESAAACGERSCVRVASAGSPACRCFEACDPGLAPPPAQAPPFPGAPAGGKSRGCSSGGGQGGELGWLGLLGWKLRRRVRRRPGGSREQPRGDLSPRA